MRTKRIPEIGDRMVAIAGVFSVTVQNDVGGHSALPPGRYRVQITKTFEDYETGRVLHGELQEERDVAAARRSGTTGFTPDHYRRKAPTLAAAVEKAAREFNPRVVYFSEHNCEPDAKETP
jgi:hypothetical protein